MERIGTGGMGEIFRAEMDGPAGIKKRVVIKRVLPHLSRDARFVERFLDEGRLMVQLSHGNVIPVFDVGVFQGQYFLAMEYVEGMDLAELRSAFMEVGTEFEPQAVVSVMDMVSKALDYVHTCCDEEGNPMNIVHRDISPPNLMVSLAGEVKILDFGIARARTHVVESMPGLLVGKVGYMAPEQVTAGESSPLSDIYGLGAVAFELLTGNLPHSGDTDVEVLDHIRNGEPTSVFELKPDAPERLGRLIDDCVSSEPGKRPQDCAELRTRILDAMRGDNLVGGEAVLSELVRSFYDSNSQGTSFDNLLDAQLAGAVGTGLAGGGGNTDVIKLNPVNQGSPHDEEYEGERETPQPRLLRWLFVTALIGVVSGLSLMFMLERSAALEDGAEASTVSAPPSLAQGTPAITTDSPASLVKPAAEPKARETKPKLEAEEFALGEKLAGENAQEAERASMQLRVNPENAEIRVGKKLLGVGSAVLEGLPGEPVSFTVSAKGYASRRATVNLGSTKSRMVRLQPLGRLEFRFFPARAKVIIDGRELDTGGSNRVSHEISVGKHQVVVRDPLSGAERALEVRVDAEKTRSLGTIELGSLEKLGSEGGRGE